MIGKTQKPTFPMGIIKWVNKNMNATEQTVRQSLHEPTSVSKSYRFNLEPYKAELNVQPISIPTV